MGEADTCASSCGVASIDALLKSGDAIFLNDIVTLVVETTADLVVLSCGVVEGTAID